MITKEQVGKLQVGDVLLQHVGWQGGEVVNSREFEIEQVTTQSVVVRDCLAVWGGRVRLLLRELPFEFWSVKEQGQ